MKEIVANKLMFENPIIFLTYLSNRYIKVQSDKYICNSIIKNSIVKIGSNKKYSEIELKGSHLHKGIRKIRHHCKKEHKVNVTGREIKALMSTRKKIHNADDVICCTYNVYIVLKSISEILLETSISKYDEYLPEYFTRINNFYEILVDVENRAGVISRRRIRIGEVINQLDQNIN